MRKCVKITRMLPCLLLLFSILISILIYTKYGQNLLEADQASEFVLADLLNHEKSLISQNWYYSTELRTVSPVPIYQIGLFLFHSWHHARIFSISLLTIASIAAFLFAARNTGYYEEAVYCAVCFTLPFSYVHSFLFTWGCFYSMYFILGCILFGLTTSLCRNVLRHFKFFLIALLGIWAGTAGIRMFMIVGIPLMITYIIIWLEQASVPNSRKIREIGLQSVGVLICVISMGIGYLINTQVLSSLYHYRQYDTLVTDSFSLTEIINRFDALLGYFSYETNVPFFSLSGGINLLTVLFVFFLFISPICLIRNTSLTTAQRTIPVFALTAIFTVWIIDCMAAGYEAASTSVGYYVMGLIFCIFCVFIFINHSHLPEIYRKVIMVCLCVLFYGNTLSFVKNHIPSHEKQQAKASAWLTENGYTNGFATFWNGNLLTELSDGVLEVIVYDTWRSREPYKWLQSVSHTHELPDGPVFLYTDTEEMLLDPSPCLDDNYLAYSDDKIRIYIYPNAQLISSLQLNQYNTQ